MPASFGLDDGKGKKKMGSPMQIHSLLAVLSTLGALAAWQLPKAKPDGEHVLVRGVLERVEWQEENWQVALYQKDNKELWLEIEKKDELKKEVKRKHYMASKQAKNLFQGLSVLKASRTLGTIDDISEFGIAGSHEKIRLQYSHKSTEFDIGGGTYGKAQTYVRDENKVIHLIASNRLAGLRHGATGLIERKAFSMNMEDVEQLILKRAEDERKLVGRKTSTGNNFFIADPAEPDAKLEQVSAWIGRLLRLRIVDVDAQMPQEPPVFIAEIMNHSGDVEKVSLWEPNERVAFMQMERYENVLMISKHEAQSLIDDIDLVFSEGR